ncbi:acyltransferase family protein [Geodermatophilus sp. SYSU D01176]
MPVERTAVRGGVARPAAPEHRFRRDIEGLRAVAVGLVLLDHVFGWPSGGFIGVDVFFVISGFLITGLLVRERQRTGRISLRASTCAGPAG